MLPPLDQFRANIGQVRAVVAIAESLDSQTTAAIDVNDNYRAALVLSVSALDHYVHEKTLAGMIEVAQGGRPMTDSFRRFRIGLSALGPELHAPPTVWLEQEVRRAHSLLTFQRADAIGDAMRLIHATPLWPDVAAVLQRDVKDVKDSLDLIVDRRNKIAHEADCEPTGLSIKWPISSSLVAYAIDYLVSLVTAIDAVV